MTNTPNMPDHELVLKSMPPRQGKGTLHRPRLSLHGPAFATVSFIEVKAPAGFGKTSLLGQWRREALESGAVVAWLSLDSREDTPRFIRGLIQTMKTSMGHSKIQEEAILMAMAAGDPLLGLTAWLAEISRLGAKTILILDEVQQVSTNFLENCLLYLMLNAPSNLSIIMGTRKSLNLPVSDVLARGMYALLDAEMLRFNLSETTQMLQQRFGTKIGPEDCVQIHEHTAGWCLGLQLIMATIDKPMHPGEAITYQQLSNQEFERYFQNFLTSHFDADEVYFLLEIAILDALHPDLCAAISSRKDAKTILQKYQTILPVFLEGQDGEWVIMHPMARELMRSRLVKMPKPVQKRLHKKAALWLSKNNMLESAAQHALEGGLQKLAFELMANSLYSELIRGNQMRVLYWLDMLPHQELVRYPKALISAAWALAESDRHRESQSLVELLLSRPNVTTEEHLESSVLLFAAAYYADDLESGKFYLSPWRDKSQHLSLSPSLRGIYHNALAMFLLYEGHPERARHLLRSTHQLSPTPILTIHAWGEWLIGMSYLWEGQVKLAAETLQPSLVRAEKIMGRRAAISVKLASALAMALWEMGKNQQALEVISGRLDVLEKVSSPESISMGYHLTAKAALSTGQEQRAFDLLEHLFALGKSRNIPRFMFTSLGEQIRIHAIRGHADTCMHLRDRLEDEVTSARLPKVGMLFSLLNLRLQLAFAFANFANRDWQTMKNELSEALMLANQLQRGRESLEIRLLLGLARLHLREDGLPILQEAISLADIWGVQSTLIHTHPELFNVHGSLEKLRERTALSLVVANSDRHHKVESQVIGQDHIRIQSGGLLTSKEEEVLRLLVKNFANKQIANTMNVSTETVKWHIKNLFTKLNAGSRRHVVDRARMLGVIG